MTFQDIQKKTMIAEYGYSYYLRHKTWCKIKDRRENETDGHWERRLKIYGYTKDGVHIKPGEFHGDNGNAGKAIISSEDENMKSITWNEIVGAFEKDPRNVSTDPMRNSACKWFYVYVENGDVCIESGKNHSNTSNIKGVRKLNRDELDDMLDLYDRRRNGECVSYEAAERTVNQVYWYGIFRELGV